MRLSFNHGRDATGVYLEGGRHWRLADAYLETLTLKEIFALLDRGGVVMGVAKRGRESGRFGNLAVGGVEDGALQSGEGRDVGPGGRS
jgi:cyanophycinase